MTRRPLQLVLLLLALAAFAAPASASNLVDRDTSHEKLAVNSDGVALVTYTVKGKVRHVLYWGAKDWDLRFKVDYSGGYGSKKADYKAFDNVCKAYTGPELSLEVAACTAPDGSSWALQRWVRLEKNGGGSATSAPVELHVSHWTGDLPTLWVKTDWAYAGTFLHLYGEASFHGKPVVPGKVTRQGAPLDAIGRNVYVDSLDSDLGGGWRRVNSFLAHKPNGAFCYAFTKQPGYSGEGISSKNSYSATLPGPGVSPDVLTTFQMPVGPYDPTADAAANAEQAQINGGATDGSCLAQN